ncbi:MAG: hypothetical protein JXQ90_11180 [Cyclobacteriaceae bacterium]
METEKKKAIILLKALIFHYHGLEQEEKKLLEEYVDNVEGKAEYDWVIKFISEDYMSAFDRAKEFLAKVFLKLEEQERLDHLMDTWEDNHKKGYVTEMETMAMITLAKDWGIEKQFIISMNS